MKIIKIEYIFTIFMSSGAVMDLRARITHSRVREVECIKSHFFNLEKMFDGKLGNKRSGFK